MDNDIPCPCIKCVAFAACNANYESICCSLLYNYFIEGGINTKHVDGSDYYTHPQSDRLQAIEVTFCKRIRNWEYTANIKDINEPNDFDRLRIIWG